MTFDIQITVDVPDYVISEPAVRAEIEKTLRGTVKNDLTNTFRKTVEGWSKPPYFTGIYTSRADYLSIAVKASGTNAEIYSLVNYGARPHVITPKRGGMLRFQPGYRAGTKPRMLSSRPAQRFGDVIGARSVNHPGFEAREFDLAVAEDVAPRFVNDVQDAIARGASK